jgi:hypothetical protein
LDEKDIKHENKEDAESNQQLLVNQKLEKEEI